MASKKISELAPASVLGGDEYLAGVQGGANVAVTPDQIADRASSALSRPQRIAFAGDSIAALFGGMNPESPWYWSLARAPRVWDYALDGNSASGNVSASGSKSGDLWSGIGRTGTKVYSAAANSFTVDQLTKLLAYRPDILFLETGTNDADTPAAALDATFLNVRDVYTALVAGGLKHLVICTVLPRAGATVSTLHYNQLVRQWARGTPGVHVLDLAAYMVDDASTTGVPLGGATGAVGAMTRDGLHPSVTFGRAAEPAVTALLDSLNIPRTLPRGVSQTEVYAASTAPGGNLLGTKGSMLGSFAGSVGGGASGSMAQNWLGTTSNAELTAVFSKGTLVDARGQGHVAQIITLGSVDGAALTGTRGVTFYTAMGAAPILGKRLAFQILAQFANLAGCTGIKVELVSNGGAVWSAPFGTNSGIYVPAQDLPTSATPENLDLVSPWNALPDAGTTSLVFQITLAFRSGVAPTGTLAFAQAGVWAETVLP